MHPSGKVYINGTSVFLPNAPVGNDDIENVLGMVGGKPSRARRIVWLLGLLLPVRGGFVRVERSVEALFQHLKLRAESVV